MAQLRAKITLDSSVFVSLGANTDYYLSSEDVVSDVFYRGIIVEPYPDIVIGRTSGSRIDIKAGNLNIQNNPFDSEHPFYGQRYRELIFENRIIDVELQYGENNPFWTGTMVLSGLNQKVLEFRLLEDEYTDQLLRYSHQSGSTNPVTDVVAGVSSTVITSTGHSFTNGQIITFEGLADGATALNYSRSSDNYYIITGVDGNDFSILKSDGLTAVTNTDVTDSSFYTADSGRVGSPVNVAQSFGTVNDRVPVVVKSASSVANPGLLYEITASDSHTVLKDNGVVIGTTDTSSNDCFAGITADEIIKGTPLDLSGVSYSFAYSTTPRRVTVTLSADHGLSVGDYITVVGSVLDTTGDTDAANGQFQIYSVPSSSSFTFRYTASQATELFTTNPTKIVAPSSLGAYGELSLSGDSAAGLTVGKFTEFVSNRLLGSSTINTDRAELSTTIPTARISAAGVVAEKLTVSDLESPLQREVDITVPLFVGSQFTVDTANGGVLQTSGSGVVTVLASPAPPGSEVFATSQTFQPSNINTVSLYESGQTSTIEYASDILDKANHDFHIRVESDGSKKIYLINRSRLPTTASASFNRSNLISFVLTPSQPLRSISSEWVQKIPVGEDGSSIHPPSLFDENRTASIDVLRSGSDESIKAIVESITDMRDHLSNYAVISLRPTAQIVVDGIYDELYFGDSVEAISEDLFITAMIMVREMSFDFQQRTTTISGDVAVLLDLVRT